MNTLKNLLQQNNVSIEAALFFGLILPVAFILLIGFTNWLLSSPN